MGERDDPRGSGVAGEAGGDDFDGVGNHRLPGDADRSEAEVLGDRGVVETDERGQRERVLAGVEEQGFGKTVVAGEDAGRAGVDHISGAGEAGFHEPRVGADHAGVVGVSFEAGHALLAAAVGLGTGEHGEVGGAAGASFEELGGTGAAGVVVGGDGVDVGAGEADGRVVVEAEREGARRGRGGDAEAGLPEHRIKLATQARGGVGLRPRMSEGDAAGGKSIGEQLEEVSAEGALAFGTRVENELGAAEGGAPAREVGAGRGAAREQAFGGELGEQAVGGLIGDGEALRDGARGEESAAWLGEVVVQPGGQRGFDLGDMGGTGARHDARVIISVSIASDL